MTIPTITDQSGEREQITVKFRPGTKIFLENYRRVHGLRSHAAALRQIVFHASGEFDLQLLHGEI